MDSKKYLYKPRMGILLISLAFLGIASVVVLFLSFEPVRSHFIGRLLVKYDLNAKLIIAAVGWAGLALTIFGSSAYLKIAKLGDRFVEIINGRFRAPLSAGSKAIIDVPLKDISKVGFVDVASTRVITVHYPSGKAEFISTMFPVKGDFDDLYQSLITITSSGSDLQT
tara:strand:+ start:598 stop:1101 length:504 start_codon:yes stop_codon:yes gene_type:complete